LFLIRPPNPFGPGEGWGALAGGKIRDKFSGLGPAGGGRRPLGGPGHRKSGGVGGGGGGGGARPLFHFPLCRGLGGLGQKLGGRGLGPRERGQFGPKKPFFLNVQV